MTKLRAIFFLLLAQLPMMALARDWDAFSVRSSANPRYGNKVSLYQDGAATEPIKDIIAKSQKFVLAQLLIVECDAASEPIIQQLEAKAQGGVGVYLIVNKMYALLSYGCLKRLEKAGVKVSRQKTHASYWVNDQQQLLIGSQSLARMFILSFNRNFLDRDIMALAQGDIAQDAISDFNQAWGEKLPETQSPPSQSTKPNQNPCFFLSENEKLGFSSWSDALAFWIPRAQKEIFLSGVKLDIDNSPVALNLKKMLETAAENGRKVIYLGNGEKSGNGEATMAINEWIDLDNIFAPLLKWLRDWDSAKRFRKHVEEYNKWPVSPNLQIWMYDQFIHYKVWTFDDEAFLVGSANFADESFEGFHEAALFCQDKNLVLEWKKAQGIDMTHAEPFQKQ